MRRGRYTTTMTQSTEIRADINLHFCLDLSTSLFMPKDEVLADVDVVVVVVEVIVKSDVFSNANFVSHYASTLTIDRHRRINFSPHLTAHDGVTTVVVKTECFEIVPSPMIIRALVMMIIVMASTLPCSAPNPKLLYCNDAC